MKFMMLYDQSFNKEETTTRTQNFQMLRFAEKLIEPMARDFRRSMEKWNGYFPLAKDMISGFSIYFCPICLTAQVIPIKDLGFDLTCEARHRCVIKKSKPLDWTPEYAAKAGQIVVQIFQELYKWINFWITDKLLIVADKIALPDRKDIPTDGAFVIKQYDIPKKYHFERVDFNRSPWLRTLFHSGKISPTIEQLNDYCAYCQGTYAILESQENNSFQYYSVFLASHKIIEPERAVETSVF